MDPPPQPTCCRVSLTEICSLYQRLFQTPADVNCVQAAVDQVCGVRLHSGFCCSSRLLDILVEVERRRWVKEQIYWDFQLLDFNRESSLSLSDVKILLQRAQESQITSMSWVDFLTKRQETSGRVTWSELETWLFEKPLGNEKTRAPLGPPENQLDQVHYQEDLRNENQRLKKQWDNEGLAGLISATEQTGHERKHGRLNQEDLTEAVELKYSALREKLFCDMLQAHYGAQVWASLDAGQKVKNLNEFKMLAQFGLEKRSELVLSQLPGAAHNFKDEDRSCTNEKVPQTWTAIQGLKELQRRLDMELRAVCSTNGGSIFTPHQYLLLFAQINKVLMESCFKAALLVVEPQWQQRFWDESPVCLETCFEELAHIRLTTGQRSKSKLDRPNLQKCPKEEDKLLSLLRRQEEARDLLFQLLQSCNHEELQEPSSTLLHKSEEHTLPIKESSGGKTARNPLRDLFLLAMMVTKTCLQEDCGAVTWGDCAVRLLVQVQLKQELELKELIQELAEGLHNNGHLSHQAIPLAVMEGQDPVSNLIQLLQPLTPQEQLHLNQLNMMLPSGQGHLSTETDEQTQGTTEAEMENEIQADNISQVSMVSEIIAGNVVKGGARNQNRYQDNDNNDQRNCLDAHVFRGKPQEQIEKDYHHGQNISPYRKRVMDFSSQTEYKNGHTDILECTTDRNLPGYQECRGKEVTSEGTSPQGNMEKSPNGPGRATHQMRPSGQTTKSEMNVKNRSRLEQVSQNEMTNSVLEATESLIAGLITLKGKVEQVYRMRGTDGQYYQRPGKNMFEADAAFTASSQNQTLVTQMEKNVIPSGRGNCDSSSYREMQPQPCKEIQCRRTCDGKGTQAEVSMGHLVPEKQSKAVTIKEEQKQKESYRWEMQSTAVTKVPSNMSCDVGTNPNTKTDIHIQTSSEHLASTVLEAAENLIGSLITLKEEISRVSQSQITREGKGAATATGTQGKQNDTWKEEGIRPQLAQLEGGKASSGNIGKNKSLEEEAMQTCEEDGCDDVPHEPMIREVSWELHPECSHGCNHAKLWDPELNSERDAEKENSLKQDYMDPCETFESGSNKTDCDNTRRCGDTELPVGSRKDLSMHSSEKGTSVQLGALNAERRELDYEGGEGDVSVPRKQECDEYSSSPQGECGEDTAEPMLLLEDPSNGGCTESDTADQLALSFLEAAQNLIGGLIPGKEETVGRMVVILTDGSAEDGDITLDQGEELSEVSGTISIMEGLSAEDSQASIMSKEDEVRDDSSHFPVNSKKGEVCESDRGCIPSGNNAHQLEECPGGHCTKTELNTQPPLPQSDGAKAMACLSGCEMMKETTLVVSECRRNEKEDEIAVQKAMTTYGGQEIINPDSNLFVTSNTDCKDNTNNIVTELQPGKEDKLMCGVKMEQNNNNLESLAACGCVESSTTLHKVCESYGDQRCDATNDIRYPLSQAEDGMDDCAMMAATDRDCGVKMIHSSSREYKETEENKPDKGKYIHQGQSGNQEEGVWKAKEGIITNQDKSNTNDGGNQEEHNDLGPCPSSPDALVRQFLLATDDLIGSLTSLKDSMEKNAKTNSMVITDSISTSTTELGNRQASTFIENTSGDSCSQSTATLSSEKNKELTAEKQITDACDSEKPEVVVVDQDKSKAIEESKEGLCTMKSEREKKDIIQKEDHQQCIFGSDDNNAMPADIIDKRPTETSSHSTIPESCGNIRSNIHQTTIENHQESEEQSNCAPSTPGGSVQPVSLSFHDKESLASQEIVPDGQERSINVKNQWRAICEKQILKSHISDRVKIQVEKSKSDFGSYKEMQDSTLLMTTAKAGSQLGNVRQLYVGNRDMEKEGSPLSTKPGDEDSSPETNAENTVTEMDGIFREPQDLNNPDSLKDLTVSLMEATSNLIGRLSSLKGQLGSSQANLHSNDNENTQNVLDPTQQRHVPRTSEEVCSEHNMNERFTNNVDPKETKFGDPDECIQGVKYEEVQNRKLQESTQIRDLSNIHTLKQYIKNEVTIRKQEDIGDREENIRNPQEESRENLGGFPEYGTTIKRDDGGSVEMDNVKLDSMELASTTDGLLKNREEPDTDKYTAQHNSHEQAMQANYLPETNVLENERRENIKRAEENYGWEEEENSTGQPEHNSDVKREQKPHPCVPTSEQAEDARMKFQTEGAGAMQSDCVLDDIPHVPANGVLVRNEAQLPYPLHRCQQPYIMLRSTGLQDTEQAKPEMKSQLCTVDNYELRASSVPLGQAALQRERVFFRLSLREQQEALRRLQDLHREAELKCTSDRRRQMLRFQERLSIARNRKSEVNLMDITQRRLPQMTPEPRPEGDAERQKSVVRERLEKMKRERTYIMQTRRDRNMSSFRELLDPVLAKDKREDSGSELRGAEGM